MEDEPVALDPICLTCRFSEPGLGCPYTPKLICASYEPKEA